jgi:leucyl-tRNA synthetase
MFLGPYEEGGDYRDAGISGVRRFLDRLYASARDAAADGAPDPLVLRKLHQTIKKVGDDVPRLSYNTAVAAMMEYMKTLRHAERVAAPRRGAAARAARRAVRAAPRRGAVGAARPLGERVRRRVARVRRGARRRGAGDRGRAGERQDARHRAPRPRRVAGRAVAAAMAEASVARHVAGAVRKVIYVPGRLLNLVVG